MRAVPFMTIAILLSATGAAGSQSLAQRQMMVAQDKELAAQVDDANQACGTAIKASIDWPTFLNGTIGNNSVNGFRGESLQTIRGMCDDALAKQAIVEKIKSYRCSFGGAGKRSLALDANGQLSMAVDWDAANTGDFVKAWLGDLLSDPGSLAA